MHKASGHCDTLVDGTADALHPGVVALMLLAVQRDGLGMSVRSAVRRYAVITLKVILD